MTFPREESSGEINNHYSLINLIRINETGLLQLGIWIYRVQEFFLLYGSIKKDRSVKKIQKCKKNLKNCLHFVDHNATIQCGRACTCV